MSTYYQDGLKAKVGKEIYARLDEEANKEVSSSLKMPLIDQYHQKQYYQQSSKINIILSECESFEKLGLKFSPIDIINIFFRSKLLFATKSPDVYNQRVGNSFHPNLEYRFDWNEKAKGIDLIISEKHLELLDKSITEKTLITQISHFDSNNGDPREFFDGLFQKLGLSFVCFFDDDNLVQKHKEMERGLRDYNLQEAKKYFCSPSIGFTTTGSEVYVHLYASVWLRTFLNLLRIAGFLNPGSLYFGQKLQITAPVYPVFLGKHATGVFCWDEDTKEPWEKIPDGCLFLSHGYRGLSAMTLDKRTFGRIERFFLETGRFLIILKTLGQIII